MLSPLSTVINSYNLLLLYLSETKIINTSVTTILAGGGGFSGFSKRLLRSQDRGQTWVDIGIAPYNSNLIQSNLVLQVFTTVWTRYVWIVCGYCNTAQGSGGVPLLWSPDGITWTQGTGLPAPTGGVIGFTDVNSNGSVSIAVSSTTIGIYVSLDGKAWSPTILPVLIYGQGIIWNGSVWMAVGSYSGGGSIFTSVDNGATWLNRSNALITATSYVSDAIFDGTKWIVCATTNTTGGGFFYSIMEPDPISLTAWKWYAGTGATFSGTGSSVSSIDWNGSVSNPVYVAAGYMPYSGIGTYSPNTILRSIDGIAWTAVSPAPFVIPTQTNPYIPTPPYYASTVSWIIDRFVVVGSSGAGTGNNTFGNQYFSTDGLTWISSTGDDLISITTLPTFDFGLSRNFSTA